VEAHTEIEALCKVGGRRAGSDAERRAARHLEARLRELERDAQVQSIDVWPRWALVYALNAAVALVGSLVSVSSPATGCVLVAIAIVSTFGDATGLFRPLRRLTGRRASQNVVSREEGDKPGILLLVAHYDAAQGGAIFARGLHERLAQLGHRVKRPLGPFELFMICLLLLLACTVLRLLGGEGTVLTLVQFLPTLALIVAIVALLDISFTGAVPGASDNASGVATVLRLAERFGGQLEHFRLWVVLSGAQEPLALGLRSFVRGRRRELDRERTVFLNVDEVGNGTVRFGRREGALLPGRSHPQLFELCKEIAEDDQDGGGYAARPLSLLTATDASAARGAGFPAITVTCRNALDYAPNHHLPTDTPGRVDGESLERAFGFCSELIERLDGQLGPELSRPQTALAED
jgi:peptidase M28-like protein